MGSRPKVINDLGGTWGDIYSVSDPMQFIDLLMFQNYLYGTSQRKIPVSETRTVFLTWLERKYTTPNPPSKQKKGTK